MHHCMCFHFRCLTVSYCMAFLLLYCILDHLYTYILYYCMPMSLQFLLESVGAVLFIYPYSLNESMMLVLKL